MSLGDGPTQIPLEEGQREEQDVQQQRQVEPPQALHAKPGDRDCKADLETRGRGGSRALGLEIRRGVCGARVGQG